LRYLSHAEMMRVFRRACARAKVKVAHSQGFNPHPRMSLVLPRSVGVESDDEMLCLRLDENTPEFNAGALSSELPEGIEIVSVNVTPANTVPKPSSVRYFMETRTSDTVNSRQELVEELLTRDEIVVERRVGKGPDTRQVDVRPFIESIDSGPTGIFVDCRISEAGTIRIDEILGLLKLEIKDLQGPVRRLSVKYNN
jgi:radical SAM-linked protein